MRILTHVLELARLGGVEVNVLETSAALVAAGHEVHVVFGPDRFSTGLPLQREMEAAGVVLHGPHPFGWSLQHTVRDWRSYRPAAVLAASLRPDVVWLHRFEHILWGRVVARRAGAPLVCHLHHVPNFRPSLTPVLARGVDGFIAVSHYMSRQWAAAGIDPSRITVLHNAVPEVGYPVGGLAERRRARAALGVPEHAFVALSYGRLEAAKGVRTLLDAWARIVRTAVSGSTPHLLLAGEVPPDDVETAARVRALVGSGGATLLPTQSDVVPLLHAADVVLFPSQLPESFGRVALEGLATGRPVVASRVGGVPEVLSGPLGRFLVEPGDVEGLADAVTALAGWRETQPQLAAECSGAARAGFSFGRHVTELEGLLSAGARRPGARTPA